MERDSFNCASLLDAHSTERDAATDRLRIINRVWLAPRLRRVTSRAFALLALLALLSPIQSACAQPDAGTLIVHEWGTFTQLQDEAGAAIGGVNTDDEPVPRFVHRLSDWLLLTPTDVPASYIYQKGAPSCHPDVTMRLETPVLYFHPPPGRAPMEHVEVTANFRGGWLSEFYPDADAQAPGIRRETGEIGHLLPSTVGALAWHDLTVGGEVTGPATTEHVWTAPRAVRAAAVQTAGGEIEGFLFYRGVAHIDAPIAVTRDAADGQLTLESRLAPEVASAAPLAVDALWLVDVRADGAVAYRSMPPVRLPAERRVLARISGRFALAEYRDGNLERLQSAVHEALVAAGLYDDEARALLSTWELSYFRSPGLRIFFLVPRAWTDQYLPLHISAPAPTEVIRVMVGRIELVTPEQRTVLARIANLPGEVIQREAQRMSEEYYSRIGNAGGAQLGALTDRHERLAAYGIDVPNSYQQYLSLGRFRNALVLDEARRRPAASLDELIDDYGLRGYSPPEPSAKAVSSNGGGH